MDENGAVIWVTGVRLLPFDETVNFSSKGSSMGHTNYWKRNAELPAEAFATAVKDCK
jgi:hypothetical protein